MLLTLALVVLLSMVGCVVSLISPRIGSFGTIPTRGKAVVSWFLVFAVSACWFALIAPEVPEETTVVHAPVISNLTYAQIDHSAHKLTELQFEEHTKATYVGKWVRWSGRVKEVEQSVFGNYKVLIDIDRDMLQDVYLITDKNTAMHVQKNQIVQFTGKIEKVYTVLGHTSLLLEQGEIE